MARCLEHRRKVDKFCKRTGGCKGSSRQRAHGQAAIWKYGDHVLLAVCSVIHSVAKKRTTIAGRPFEGIRNPEAILRLLELLRFPLELRPLELDQPTR